MRLTALLSILALTIMLGSPAYVHADVLSDTYCPVGSVFSWSGAKADPGEKCGDPWSQEYTCLDEGRPVRKGMHKFPGRNEDLCVPKPPLAITLTSSFGESSVVAGTRDVSVARYRLTAESSTDPSTTVELPRISLSFSGGARGLSDCAFHDGDKQVSPTFTPPNGGFSINFPEPLQVSANAPSQIAIRCNVENDALGGSFAFGIIEQSVLVQHGKELFAPDTAVAPRPDGRPGSASGERFTVVPRRILDEATIASITTTNGRTAFEPGEQATLLLKIANTGGTTWSPTTHYLSPSRNSTNVALWSATEKIELPESMQPGSDEAVEFMIPVLAPAEPGEYKLGWHLVSKNDDGRLQQQEKTIVLTVIAPEPVAIETEAVPAVTTPIIPDAVVPPAATPIDANSNTTGVNTQLGESERGTLQERLARLLGLETEPAINTPVSATNNAVPVSPPVVPPTPPATTPENPETPPVVTNPTVPMTPIVEVPPVIVATPVDTLPTATTPPPSSSLPLPTTEGVKDPIKALQDIGKAIYESLLQHNGGDVVDFVTLKKKIADETAHFSGLPLDGVGGKKAVLQALPENQLKLEYPVGFVNISIPPAIIASDFSVDGTIFNPEEVGRELQMHPLPANREIVGEVLMGTIYVKPKPDTLPLGTAIFNQPVKVEFRYEDQAFDGWGWKPETLCVYRLNGAIPTDPQLLARCPIRGGDGKDTAWRPLENVEVETFSKNLIVVNVAPNQVNVGTVTLLGERQPPPPPPPPPSPPSNGGSLYRAPSLTQLLGAAACSWTSFFGWPLPEGCK